MTVLLPRRTVAGRGRKVHRVVCLIRDGGQEDRGQENACQGPSRRGSWALIIKWSILNAGTGACTPSSRSGDRPEGAETSQPRAERSGVSRGAPPWVSVQIMTGSPEGAKQPRRQLHFTAAGGAVWRGNEQWRPAHLPQFSISKSNCLFVKVSWWRFTWQAFSCPPSSCPP